MTGYRRGRTSIAMVTLALIIGLVVAAAPRLAWSRPDTRVCRELATGRALCHHYCRIGCPETARPKCEKLRARFLRKTGETRFPCDPPLTCPTRIEVESRAGGRGVLDVGWTGLAHDAPVVDGGRLTASITGCESAVPPCGSCTFSGPIPNADAADYLAGTGSAVNNRRCTGNSRTTCTANADCVTAGGACEFFASSFLPLSFGGVSICLQQTIPGALTGAVDVETGALTVATKVQTSILNGFRSDLPCARCVGDAVPNDGIRGGTCDPGTNEGQSCDVNGIAGRASFGPTSLDCPSEQGRSIGMVLVDLESTSGTVTKTLSEASPRCRAAGFGDRTCFCDTCNDAVATPCDENADCADPDGPIGPICGGRRCLGPSPSRGACTTNADCSAGGLGGVCGRPGAAPRPNECFNDVCSPTAGNEGECAEGPVDRFCGPDRTNFCLADADCAFSICDGGTYDGLDCTLVEDCLDGTCAPQQQQTCSVMKTRPCFPDNGVIGATVAATGLSDPFDFHGEADPTAAALFCMAQTSAPAVNATIGLPGLARLELPLHARLVP